jgi:type I restriction enzyme S subunit
MMKNWQNVPLGELLKKSDAWLELDPTTQYKEITVRLWGKGVVLRREVSGTEIADKRRLRVNAGQFILSRIDARNGAFGLIPNELDRAIVSNDFPVFEVNASRLLPAFLGWLSRTSEFVDSCRQASEGTTNRVRLKENKFFTIPILLPPLSEQQRIVAKIEQLAAKVEEAQKLRQQTKDELQTLIASEIRRIFTDQASIAWQQRCLGDFVIDDCYGTSEKTYDAPIGTPILRMGNIQEGRLDRSDLKYLPIAEKDRQKWILEKGDILVNRTNSAELVGKCAVFDLNSEYGFASYLIRLRLDTTKADPYLVAMYINSPIGREYMFRERKQMTGQANVNAVVLQV